MQTASRSGTVLLFILTIVGVWSIATGQAPQPVAVQKWELTKVDRGTEGWQKAQALAGEGWELVTVDLSGFYLKRPK